MNALCIGRHQYLSDFLAAYFRDATLDTTAVVGLAGAELAAEDAAFDVVICDYDLLSSLAAERWKSHRGLSAAPLVAVSLTRRADEAPALDGSALSLYVYLPSAEPEVVRQKVAGLGRPTPYSLPPLDRSRETSRPTA